AHDRRFRGQARHGPPRSQPAPAGVESGPRQAARTGEPRDRRAAREHQEYRQGGGEGMAWLVRSAIFLVVGGIALMVAIGARQQADASGTVVRPENERALLGGFLVAGLCLTGFLILTFVSSINLVGQRQVGIVKSF